ncbi:MAG: NUDIX domain-containing protein [Acutalibacteraceae bacterium]|nr:NUDIX domain-containing protein [Acutalibacteraceae bacterium]
MKQFCQKTGRTIGVVYRSNYNLMVVDLVRDAQGNVFAYERVMPAVEKGAVVTVPIYDGKYVLLQQYRHAIRQEQYAYPRGFGEEGLTAEQNAVKEIAEELGAEVISTEAVGSVIADSGLRGGYAEVIVCELKSFELKKDYEGIKELILLSENELQEWLVNGKINDGFTLSAIALLGAKRTDRAI